MPLTYTYGTEKSEVPPYMLVSTEVDATTGLPMGNSFISTSPPDRNASDFQYRSGEEEWINALEFSQYENHQDYPNIFKTRLTFIKLIAELKSRGYELEATTPTGNKILYTFFKKP